MIITITKQMHALLSAEDRKRYGIDEEKFRSYNSQQQDLNLIKFSKHKVLQLKNTLAELPKGTRGATVAVRDITAYLQTEFTGAAEMEADTMKSFANVLMRYLAGIPGHRIYRQNDMSNANLAYYVGSVQYHPPVKTKQGVIPPYTSVHYYWRDMTCVRSGSFTIGMHALHKKVINVLHGMGWFPETPELRATYLKDKAEYDRIRPLIGLQMLGTGVASDNMDGNPSSNSRSWWHSSSTTIKLDTDDGPSRVVVDVVKEDPDSDNNRHNQDSDANVDHTYWLGMSTAQRDDDDDDFIDTEEEIDETKEIQTKEEHREEIPHECDVPLFHLKKHLRLWCHVSQLTEYKYDRSMGDRLILPDGTRELVDMLLVQKGEKAFEDIIVGKGGGTVIMCEGGPGLGKTLTAEVYAEVAEKPLYSVQCSQLGLTAEEMEAELLKVFARSARWQAVTLLDEAEVYISERGQSLEQNAIVGVFLRVLEYYKGTLFMTTNRADTVDDAVLSRCTARVHYELPTAAAAKRIWRTLVDGSGLKMSDAVIKEVIEDYPHQSGRDIKNLIKLARRKAGVGKPITMEHVKFAKQFKPTRDLKEQS